MTDRGVSPVVGMVFLVGLTVFVAVSVIVVGVTVIDDAQSDAERNQAENSMVEFAASADEVATSRAKSQEFAVSEDRGATRVDESAGEVSVVLHRDGGEVPILRRNLGVYRHETSDGTEIAYQGGGVWRDGEGATQIVEPPAFEYRNSSTPTLSFPIVRIREPATDSDTTDGELRVADTTERFPQNETLSNPVDGDYLTLDIQSQYCEGWQSHIDDQTDDEIEERCSDSVETTAPNELRVNMTVGNVTLPDDNATDDNETTFDVEAGVLGHTVESDGSSRVEGDAMFESRGDTWISNPSGLTVTGNETAVSNETIEETMPFRTIDDAIDEYADDCRREGWIGGNPRQLNGSDVHCVPRLNMTAHPLEIDATNYDQTIIVQNGGEFSSRDAYIDVEGSHNVTIFVDGKMEFNGDGDDSRPFGNVSDPQQTTVVTSGKFLISGHTRYYGIAIAPNSNATIESARSYVEGALLGDRVEVNTGTVVHNASSWQTEIPGNGTTTDGNTTVSESDLYYLHVSEVALEVDG